MDHHHIEEHNITDRYLLGKLHAEERAQFEAHFIDCRECLDRLETTEDFGSALRRVAAEEVARSYATAGLLTRVTRLSRGRQAALMLGAILLLAAVPVALLIRDGGRSRDELANSTAELQRQVEESRQSAERLAREQQESERQTSEQRRQLEAQLVHEQQERARMAQGLEKLTGPRAGAPVFILSIVRSGGTDQPVNRIFLPRSSPQIILSPELEKDPDVQSYRATLQTADNRTVWSASDLHPNSKDALRLSLNTSLFEPGNYVLTLEGLTLQGRYIPVGRYPFRAIRQ